jgi:hypothetical protein
MMAAKLLHYAVCPDLLAVSVYNTKPVHILSTVVEVSNDSERKGGLE